ncbi:NAD-dependent epimerase/dehydratase family protein [Succinivibrio dextrinosolvens]|uniref:NAD-dependent epimerase/dehydratase family protein n=1 Tax=Succinivibrio dextrinosolvens TaxID=83771 RepID=UPI001920D9A8|nr:NAD(P)-dependent oxidoreductase [Succinivibrio dextrinosolvens]
MKKAVITGATGAIGRSLINICIQNEYEVLVVVHRSSTRASDLKNINHCSVLWLDLDEYDNALEEMKKQEIDNSGYDLFFHLAWKAPFGKDRDNLDLQLTNIDSTLSAVRFAKSIGCSTFVGIGSQAEYGRVDGILSPETPAYPESGYGIAKLCSSQFAKLACEQQEIQYRWCRILSVYGPYDREQTLISYALTKMLNNEDTSFSPCEQMWDYIYSDDAANAIFLVGMKGENGGIYMIGSGVIRPLKDYIKDIADITGYKKDIGFGKRPYNDKQVMFLQADVEGLKKLGWNHNITFENGIRKYVNWLKKESDIIS